MIFVTTFREWIYKNKGSLTPFFLPNLLVRVKLGYTPHFAALGEREREIERDIFHPYIWNNAIFREDVGRVTRVSWR